MTREEIYNMGDTIDTGEYGARKNAPSSAQERERVFADFEERMKKADLSFLDKKVIEEKIK